MTVAEDVNLHALSLILGCGRGPRSLCRRGANGAFRGHGTAESADSMLERALISSRDGYDTWFGVHPLLGEPAPGRRGLAVDVASVGVLHVDVDFADEAAHKNAQLSEVEARGLVASFDLQPTVAINSGHGLHLYWCLDELLSPTDGATLLNRLHEELAAHGLYPERKDVASVLRVPGTTNYKVDPPRPVVVESLDPSLIFPVSVGTELLDAYRRRRLTTPTDCEAATPSLGPTIAAVPSTQSDPALTPDGNRNSCTDTHGFDSDLIPDVEVSEAKVWRYQRHVNDLAATPEGGRNTKLNDVCFKVGQDLVNGRCDLAEAQCALDAIADVALEIGLTEAETEATISSGFGAGVAA